nr:zinc finger, CCHC-type [Tanacetum cinerariifolium]
MSHQNTPRPNKRQPRNPNRSNPPTPDDTFTLRNPSPNTKLLRPQSYYHQPYPNQPYRNPTPASEQYGFHSYGSQPNAFQNYLSQHSSFPFSYQDYVSQTQMGGSSKQPRTDPPWSLINAFSIEELHTPEFLESLQENTSYWHQPNAYKAVGDQVTTLPTKKKKANRNRQKRSVQTNDAARRTMWTIKEEVALAKGWRAIFENSQHGNARKKYGFWCEVLAYIVSKTKQEGYQTYEMVKSGARDEDYLQKEMIHYGHETGVPFRYRHSWDVLKDSGKDKARAAAKNKWSKASGSSTMNDDALARLMINEMTAAEVEQRDAFMKLKRGKKSSRDLSLCLSSLALTCRSRAVGTRHGGLGFNVGLFARKRNVNRDMTKDSGDNSKKEISTTSTPQFQCPMLKPLNYSLWAIRMQMILEANGLWETIEPNEKTQADYRKDKTAIAFLYQALPEDQLLKITKHKTAKAICDALKTRHIREERVQQARLETLKSDFEMLYMKEDETIDTFTTKLTTFVHKAASLDTQWKMKH